jgi:hypothetical protein
MKTNEVVIACLNLTPDSSNPYGTGLLANYVRIFPSAPTATEDKIKLQNCLEHFFFHVMQSYGDENAYLFMKLSVIGEILCHVLYYL